MTIFKQMKMDMEILKHGFSSKQAKLSNIWVGFLKNGPSKRYHWCKWHLFSRIYVAVISNVRPILVTILRGDFQANEDRYGDYKKWVFLIKEPIMSLESSFLKKWIIREISSGD